MFTNFFYELRDAGIPATLKEYLTLMEAMDAGVAEMRIDNFYYLSRATFVKDEKNLDKFDKVFGHVFNGLEFFSEEENIEIPEDWLRKMAELFLSPEEMAEIEAQGGWDEILEKLKERLAEQEKRHEGGSKWIGTGGTSPFGAYGYNPMGVRMGQEKNRHNRAIKVWDKRNFKNLDDSVELGTRNIKMALRKLRRFAREGSLEEFDLDGTINATARKGYLDIKMVPERHNAVKVLLFLDVGGSMDPHIRMTEELFSAARSEFKHLEFFYFHNCLYEGVWRDNTRRHKDRTPTMEILHTYPHDYKLIFVGDASMSPYEISYPGGGIEHWNEEPGEVWIRRALEVYSRAVWLNPIPEKHWEWGHSIQMIKTLMNHRMYPLTLDGLDRAMAALRR
jgi:uncharacterized protein